MPPPWEQEVMGWCPCSVCDSCMQPGPGDLPALLLPGDGITRSQLAAASPREHRGNPDCSPSPLHLPGFHQEYQVGRTRRRCPGWVHFWGSLGWMEGVLPPPLTQLGTPQWLCQSLICSPMGPRGRWHPGAPRVPISTLQPQLSSSGSP